MTSHAKHVAWPVGAALLVGLSGAASGQDIEAIYTKIPDHPTSLVPGAVDLDGNPIETRFRAFHDLVGSPDGSHWLLRGRTQQGSDAENILLLGSGGEGTSFAQEGQPIPDAEPGEVYDFFGSALGRFNEDNDFAFSARARGGDSDVRQKVLRVIDGEAEIATQMGDPYFGLVDNPPDNSGNETVGNSIGSIHLLNDGTIGAMDPTIQNISALNRPATFYDNHAFHQTNVTTVESFQGGFTVPWTNMSNNSFYSTPDYDPDSGEGGGWITRGRIDSLFGPDMLVVNGKIVIQEGQDLPDSSRTVDDINNANIAPNGDWFARGSDTNDNAWAVRNGEIFAVADDPVPGGVSGERWTSFSTFTGNAHGDWILVGSTNLEDETRNSVIVVNGEVVVREDDPVVLPGNGQWDGNVFIGRGNPDLSAFSSSDVFLSDDGVLYFLANIRDGDGNDLNSDPSFSLPLAFLRIDVAKAPDCPADLTGDGMVGGADLGVLLSEWGDCADPDDCPADLTGDGSVGGADLGVLLSEWGDC